MNICLVGHFPPHIGGISSYLSFLSKELIKRGDKVYVLTYPHKDVKDFEGIPVETAFTINIKGLRGILFSIFATFKLIKMVKKYDIDLIHAHYILPPGLISVIVGKILKKKTAITIHGSDIMILASNPILRYIIRFILKNSDDIFVVSNALKYEVLKLGITQIKNKITVTWNIVDVDKFRPGKKSNFKREIGINSEKPVILFVGNLVPQKGVEYLIKSKKFLKTDAEIVIVGNGPLYPKLKGMVEYEGIKGVTFTGARNDIYNVMPAADVVVLPSISESFGIVLLEAMASGKPVVGTDVGGIPEVINENFGIIVKPRKPMELAEAINKILLDNQLKKKMGYEARKIAMKFATLEIPY
jgi:L-malate glycosyltransferase